MVLADVDPTAGLRVYSLIGDWDDNTDCEAFALWLLARDMPDARRQLAEELSFHEHCSECFKQPENVMTAEGNGCAYLIAAFVSDLPLEGVAHSTVCRYEATSAAGIAGQGGE